MDHTELIIQNEGEPDSYPAAPTDLSEEAAALDPAFVWQRIEDWINHRWGERSVTWVVQGPGVWMPPLQPATVNSIDLESGGSIDLADAAVGDRGYILDDAVYVIDATVGTAESPPARVMQAYTRLAEYVVATQVAPATSHTLTIGGMSHTEELPAAWLAKAIHYSGAADLLRKYR